MNVLKCLQCKKIAQPIENDLRQCAEGHRTGVYIPKVLPRIVLPTVKKKIRTYKKAA